MATQVQRRRGTTAQTAAFTGAIAEITIDTTKNTVVVHDGVTAGGHPLLKEAAVGVDVVSQDSATGAAQLPSGTTAQRPAGVNGEIRFNSDLNQFEGFKNGDWLPVGGGATGSGSDDVFYENSTTVTESYELSAGKNAFSVGPISINSGVAVTVPSGQRWVVE
jgi:hypothetical protein